MPTKDWTISVMKRRIAIAGIKFIGAVIVAACAGCLYLCAPVLGKISLRAWWVVGLIVAMAIGAINDRIAGKWLYVGVSVAIGLVISAAYAESSMADYEMGVIESICTGIRNLGYEFIVPGIVAAYAGAFLIHFGMRRKKQFTHTKGNR